MNDPNVSFPLNDGHLSAMINGCQSCEQTAQILGKLKAAGYDTSDMEAVNEQQHTALKSLRGSFFPGR